MKKLSTIALLVFVIISSYSQTNQNKSKKNNDIEYIDSLLIGKSLKKAIKILQLDTNWHVISEPPLKLRGIDWESDTLMIQIYVEPTMTKITGNHIDNITAYKFDQIKNKKIIGVSWSKINKCRSVGTVIWYYALDRFGPCKENE